MIDCECHHETGSHSLCCGHDEGRSPDCPIHGDGSGPRAVPHRLTAKGFFEAQDRSLKARAELGLD